MRRMVSDDPHYASAVIAGMDRRAPVNDGSSARHNNYGLWRTGSNVSRCTHRLTSHDYSGEEGNRRLGQTDGMHGGVIHG